jgi:hypothetical protein
MSKALTRYVETGIGDLSEGVGVRRSLPHLGQMVTLRAYPRQSFVGPVVSLTECSSIFLSKNAEQVGFDPRRFRHFHFPAPP